MRMNECEIVVYNKVVDFEILSNFYFKHFFKSFWCSNRRYNGSHVSICTNKVRKCFELTFMWMHECEIVVLNKSVNFEILSNFDLPQWALIPRLSVDIGFSSWVE